MDDLYLFRLLKEKKIPMKPHRPHPDYQRCWAAVSATAIRQLMPGKIPIELADCGLALAAGNLVWYVFAPDDFCGAGE